MFENVKFKEIQELYLNNNKITNIEVLAKVQFQQLKILNLNTNLISDINILEKVKLPMLNTLELMDNIIEIKKYENIITLFKCKIKKFKI